MKNCKRCSGDVMKFIKDYERYEDDKTEIIDVWQCQECLCIHWDNSYEFFGKEMIENNAVNKWAMTHSAK